MEEIVDASREAERIEVLLPVGVRPRQLRARTLLIGMVLAMLAGCDALLTTSFGRSELSEDDHRRLGVIAPWNDAGTSSATASSSTPTG